MRRIDVSGEIEAGYYSYIGIPLEARGHRLGTWCGFRKSAGPFGKNTLALLQAVSRQLSFAIENARLFDEARARARREQILREITARVRNSTDPDAIVRSGRARTGLALGRQTFIRLGDAEQLRPAATECSGTKCPLQAMVTRPTWKESSNMFLRLATQIREQLNSLVDQYDARLRMVPGYANLPQAARRDLEQHVLQLIADCLEANDDSRLIQYIHERAEQVLTHGFQPEWFQQAVTIPQDIITPLVETVAESNFVWRALGHAQTAAWEIVAQERRRDRADPARERSALSDHLRFHADHVLAERYPQPHAAHQQGRGRVRRRKASRCGRQVGVRLVSARAGRGILSG